MTVGVTLDTAALARLIDKPDGEVDRWFLRLCNRIANNAKRRCNVDTGVLRDSIVTERIGDTYRVVARTDYAIFVHEGRGPVFARPGGVLVFRPKGGGPLVFTRRVGPYAGNPFLSDAMVEEVNRL